MRAHSTGLTVLGATVAPPPMIRTPGVLRGTSALECMIVGGSAGGVVLGLIGVLAWGAHRGWGLFLGTVGGGAVGAGAGLAFAHRHRRQLHSYPRASGWRRVGELQ